MMTFKQFLRRLNPRYLDEVFLTEDGTSGECLREGKWVSGRFSDNVRIDRATHLLSGEQHAHIYGRNRNLVGVVNFDGSKSHGGEIFQLHTRDADALRRRGFNIAANNIVEWVLFDVVVQGALLLG